MEVENLIERTEQQLLIAGEEEAETEEAEEAEEAEEGEETRITTMGGEINVYKSRWIMLALFSLCTAGNAILWITFHLLIV